MITIKLMGGMGNQMFQYALGRQLALKHQTDLVLDLSFLLDRTPRPDFTFRDYNLDIFNLSPVIFKHNKMHQDSFVEKNLKKIEAKFRQIFKKSDIWIREESSVFKEAVLNSPNGSKLQGYWQSEKYFKAIEDVLRQDFTFKNKLCPAAAKMAERVGSVESVAVHVRRGDYVAVKTFTDFHGVMTDSYFLPAADLMASKIQNPIFFIFSDDLDWCKQNLILPYPHQFVEHDCDGDKFGDYFALMSFCRHQIISNSSFSWWAAWLNSNPNKVVVAPRRWFKAEHMDDRDLVPESWLRI